MAGWSCFSASESAHVSATRSAGGTGPGSNSHAFAPGRLDAESNKPPRGGRIPVMSRRATTAALPDLKPHADSTTTASGGGASMFRVCPRSAERYCSGARAGVLTSRPTTAFRGRRSRSIRCANRTDFRGLGAGCPSMTLCYRFSEWRKFCGKTSSMNCQPVTHEEWLCPPA